MRAVNFTLAASAPRGADADQETASLE